MGSDLRGEAGVGAGDEATSNTITRRYLELVSARVDDACRSSELLSTAYNGAFLPRPVFLEDHERDQVAADLDGLWRLLNSLPDRLFGGDRAAMAKFLGWEPPQVAVLEAYGGASTSLGRADLYRDSGGFKALEFNISSALGGFENAEMGRRARQHPEIDAFLWAHDLVHHDTLGAIVDTLFAECPDLDPDDEPVVALVDWPSSYDSIARRLGFMAELLEPYGIAALPCHAGQIEVAGDGSLRVGGQRLDAVYRFFLIQDLVEFPEAPELVTPILEAARRGKVSLFAPYDSELFGSKGSLALLASPRHQSALTAEERALVERILPMTRLMTEGVTEVDGERVGLRDYALAHREELVLKPVSLHGGQGVVCGWTVSAEAWERSVREAAEGPFVIQRRVRPQIERMAPLEAAEGDEVALNWGVFTASGGYAGAIVRGSPDPDVGVVSMGNGARVACCFTPGA